METWFPAGKVSLPAVLPAAAKVVAADDAAMVDDAATGGGVAAGVVAEASDSGEATLWLCMAD